MFAKLWQHPSMGMVRSEFIETWKSALRKAFQCVYLIRVKRNCDTTVWNWWEQQGEDFYKKDSKNLKVKSVAAFR